VQNMPPSCTQRHSQASHEHVRNAIEVNEVRLLLCLVQCLHMTIMPLIEAVLGAGGGGGGGGGGGNNPEEQRV